MFMKKTNRYVFALVSLHKRLLYVLVPFIWCVPLTLAEAVPFTERVISATAFAARSVFAEDVDGDGDTDVLSASTSDDKIAWYENNGGSPPIFTERVISNSADGARSVYAADVDSDGDIDVLSFSGWDSKVAWYENDGGSFPQASLSD